MKLRFTLETVLRSHGFEVTAFGTAEEAKKNLDGATAAIIDLRLPDQQGDALAREIREKNPAARLIIITAYDAAGVGAVAAGGGGVGEAD